MKEKAIETMLDYYSGDASQIDHTLKVLRYRTNIIKRESPAFLYV